VEAALARFTGPIEQVPPAYSALMVDGQRAYDLARAGQDVELKSRAVTVFSLRTCPTSSLSPEGEGSRSALHEKPVPFRGGVGEGHVLPLSEITLIAHVSKGTYIRSLARDIALALGTVGHVTMLRRLRAGPFGLDQAISLDKLNETGKGAPLENVLLPLEAGLVDIPALDLGPEQASMVRQGRVLTGLAFHDGLHWARSGQVPVALVELAGGSLTVVRGFNLNDVAE
jgi:tRNA pseudouridine55 synthase